MTPDRARWEMWASKHITARRGNESPAEVLWRRQYRLGLLERMLDEAPYLALADPNLMPEQVQRTLVWLVGWDDSTLIGIGQLIDEACKSAVEHAVDPG